MKKPEKTERKQGRFAKGESGNPQGRPRGARNKATVAAMILLEGEAEALTRVAVTLALEGDTTALRLCLERLAPPAKERPLPPLDLPTAKSAADLPRMTAAIVHAVADGDITPGEGERLAGLVAAHGKALETAELEARITALEDRSNA